jgi:hypothetical protein
MLSAFASPAGFHFFLEKETKQRIQGYTHFLTLNKSLITKQAPTPSYGRQTRPLFLTL